MAARTESPVGEGSLGLQRGRSVGYLTWKSSVEAVLVQKSGGDGGSDPRHFKVLRLLALA